MENTLENKAKFFLMHFKSEAIWRDTDMDEEIDEVAWEFINFEYLDETDYLELKPISSITDEHAIIIGYRDSDHFKIDANENFLKDELRQMGYAIEWMGLSVEELVNFGWIKLKNY